MKAQFGSCAAGHPDSAGHHCRRKYRQSDTGPAAHLRLRLGRQRRRGGDGGGRVGGRAGLPGLPVAAAGAARWVSSLRGVFWQISSIHSRPVTFGTINSLLAQRLCSTATGAACAQPYQDLSSKNLLWPFKHKLVACRAVAAAEDRPCRGGRHLRAILPSRRRHACALRAAARYKDDGVCSLRQASFATET